MLMTSKCCVIDVYGSLQRLDFNAVCEVPLRVVSPFRSVYHWQFHVFDFHSACVVKLQFLLNDQAKECGMQLNVQLNVIWE